ncbi:MAG: peptidoglycan/xylan/chitin deacetylase (PgdA/CDA1 family) [Saprospiraceae bacterium]|jgi:peptidoglycan/xylan/chitin deacetylase (PgdA/CDA1 family)
MKKRLLKIFQPLATKIPLEWLISISGQRLFLPFYHSVQNEVPLSHIQHLYPLRTVKNFEKDIDFLLKNYTPIDLRGLVDQLKSGKPFEANTFFLSFDDGLREVYDFIEPILSKKGVPATIFLNAAFVDNRDLFFRYKASLLIDHLEKSKISAATEKIIRQRLGVPHIKQAILKVNYQNRKVLDEIAEYLEISFDDFLNQYQPYLSTEQINRLLQKGYTFGSHSVDHPLYSDLTSTEQIRQTKDSQYFINNNFPQDVKAFAFPFTDHGVPTSFFETIKKEQLLDITFGTAGLKNDSTAFHLQRFPVEEFPFQIHEMVATEYFYYFGKSFLGKNRINRK